MKARTVKQLKAQIAALQRECLQAKRLHADYVRRNRSWPDKMWRRLKALYDNL